MLRLFQKYSRLLAIHPIFSNRDLFLKVLAYLNGQDLSEVVCVCFHWKSTVLSEPSLEVRILKWKLRTAHRTIEDLTARMSQPQIREYQSRPLPSYSNRKLSEPTVRQGSRTDTVNRWLNFIDLFHYYAYRNDFPLLKRADFETEETWKNYQTSLTSFYNEFLGYFNEVRHKQVRRPKLPGLLSWFGLKLNRPKSLK